MICEGVYINGIKGNKANLTYRKGQNYSPGQLRADDNLKTDKMDQNNSDTYIVPLKNGINSYNITSINGQYVMHYFKKKFSNERAKISLQGKNGEKNEYEMEMENSEFNSFLQQFINKVGLVIEHALSESKQEVSRISIYPIPSSSKFNETMAREISSLRINGLPIQVIRKDILLKDVQNLEKDTDFINRNKEYYNSQNSNSALNKPLINYVDKALSRYHATMSAKQFIDIMNECVTKILNSINNIRTYEKIGRPTDNLINSMVTLYKKYYDAREQLFKITYSDPTKDGDGISKLQSASLADIKKYSKGASIDNRTDYVWNIVKKYLYGEKCPINGKPYTKLPIQLWDEKPFEIKKLSNPERLALKNYFIPNPNEEFLKCELERIKGTALVIFDDNISGGATLADIAYQFKKLGVENVIPITFGKMAEKWQMGAIPINRPNGDFNY